MAEESKVVHIGQTQNGTISIVTLFGKYAVRVEYNVGGRSFVEILPTLKDAQVAYCWQKQALENYVPPAPSYLYY